MGEASVPVKQMSVGGAVFLGVGAMVGAGIFALLGEAGALAGSAVWLSFLFGGIVAGLLGYTVSKLSVRYPSKGGLVSFLQRGFGDTHVSGIASWLYYMAGLIVTALVALSFGSYARSLFLPDDASAAWVKVFAVVAVISMALVYVVGPDVVGRLQSVIVVVLLIVFAVFIVATVSDVDVDQLAVSTYPSAGKIVASVALTFFAYLGFAVIATTAEAIPRPGRNVPLATYVALGIATFLYVLISIGVYGTLTVDEVIASGDTALAEAAEPRLGQAGFTMMAIAALLATASSVNANLFAAGNMTASLAEAGQFPPVFGGRARVLGTRGLAISVGIVVVMALFLDLSTVASVGSAVALAVFAMVGVAAIRLRAETGSNLALLLAAVATTLVVLVLFAVDTARNEPRTFVAMLAVGVAAAALDFLWKRQRERRAPGGTRAAGS
jgi:amino acid transporter